MLVETTQQSPSFSRKVVTIPSVAVRSSTRATQVAKYLTTKCTRAMTNLTVGVAHSTMPQILGAFLFFGLTASSLFCHSVAVVLHTFGVPRHFFRIIPYDLMHHHILLLSILTFVPAGNDLVLVYQVLVWQDHAARLRRVRQLLDISRPRCGGESGNANKNTSSHTHAHKKSSISSFFSIFVL